MSRALCRPAAVLIALVIVAPLGRAQASLPVVPGAFGFGMSTRAAYGGPVAPQILRVTNTLSVGPGSLRDAVSTPGPRVVIFETSGNIDLADQDIVIRDPYITIAGQTAPSPGISIIGGGLVIFASDVLVQHIRVRPGDGGERLPQTSRHDGILVYTYDVYHPTNVVLDHVSVSWAGGKNLNLVLREPTATVTVWRSITAEALFHAANVIVAAGEPSSLGCLLLSGRFTLSGNLFAHNSDRNPEIHEWATVQLLNNVIYDWGKDSIEAGGSSYQWGTFFYAVNPGPMLAAIVGNQYIAGRPPHPYPLSAVGTWTGDRASQVYVSDNLRDETLAPIADFFLNPNWFDPRILTSPVSLSGVTAKPAAAIREAVLSDVGARPADRDAVDARIVGDVRNYAGTVISSPAQVGGPPALAVNRRPLTVPANPHAVTARGYTNLETWLHGYSAAVETTRPPPLGPPHRPTAPRVVQP